MTVREKIALIIADRLGAAPIEVNGATLVLDLTSIGDDAVFFDIRVFGDNEPQGQVVVPVVTAGCEHLDRYSPEGPVDT